MNIKIYIFKLGKVLITFLFLWVKVYYNKNWLFYKQVMNFDKDYQICYYILYLRGRLCMKTENLPSKCKLLVTTMFLFISLMLCYFYEYHQIYSSIDVSVSKTAIIEYGSPNYDIRKVVDSIDGEIVSIKKDVDTTKIGPQEIIVEVEKNQIIKEVPIIVEVKDTVAPEIQLKEKMISLTTGEDFDMLSNLSSVYDKVDGKIEYQQKEIVNDDVDTNYYTVESNVDTTKPGTYEVVVRAVDKYGNQSSVTYSVEVSEKVEEVASVSNANSSSNYQNDYVASGNMTSLVQLAYSLIGSPYVSGGNSPAGFDCSGFVQYLYSQIGISVSRSSSTQMYDGVAVSYENAQPGDILIWGYSSGVPTHSAIYVGNGQMIHATNPVQGVIASDVAAWTRGSGTYVIAVRRI